jgi:hypothetical protein
MYLLFFGLHAGEFLCFGKRGKKGTCFLQEPSSCKKEFFWGTMKKRDMAKIPFCRIPILEDSRNRDSKKKE